MKIRAIVTTDIPDDLILPMLDKAGVKFIGEADAVLALAMIGIGGVQPAVRALLLDAERGATEYGQPYVTTTERSQIQTFIELEQPATPLPRKKPAKKAAKKSTARKRARNQPE